MYGAPLGASGVEWKQLALVRSPTPAANANFGLALSVYGDTVVVGEALLFSGRPCRPVEWHTVLPSPFPLSRPHHHLIPTVIHRL